MAPFWARTCKGSGVPLAWYGRTAVPSAGFAARAAVAPYHFNGGDCHCSNTLAAPDCSELFVRGRFHAHVGFARTDRCCNVLSHLRSMRREFRRLRDDSCINIEHTRILLAEHFGNAL